jgi:protein-S-isoprenylcysteine O-methyltransferase Ste14
VTFPAWIAAMVLFLQLPIPLYWFVLHPLRGFWRRYPRSVYAVGLSCSWLPVTIAIVTFHQKLFADHGPSTIRLATGLALIGLEAWIFWRVHRDLGTVRLVGKTELEGAGELECGGIYSRIRHPRYLASFLAILGAGLLAGTRYLYLAAAVWLALMAAVIILEEREMSTRFGATYRDYCGKVPRFFPRAGSRG